jgi:site-specific DNA recombinase
MTLRARLDQFAVQFADGAIDDRQMRTGTARVKAQLADVEGQMADAGRVDVLGPLVHAEDVQKVWEALSTDTQRRVIDTSMIIRLKPPGRGTRTLRPDSVIIEPRM